MKRHQIAWLIVLALLILAPVRAEATSHFLAKLCAKINCSPVLDTILPKITQADSPITPGRYVVVQGSGFGQEKGELWFTGLWTPPVGDELAAAKSVKLIIPAPGPVWDFWTPTLVIGQVPDNITRVRDQPVKLQIKTKGNKWSNEYPINFKATQEQRQLPGSDVQVSCSTEADADWCNNDQDYNKIPYCYWPLVGWHGGTFSGYHWTCVGSSDGTDSFSASLKNDWRFEHAALADLSGSVLQTVAMSGFQKGTTSTNVSLYWNNAYVSYVLYRVYVYIVGPKGVPH